MPLRLRSYGSPGCRDALSRSWGIGEVWPAASSAGNPLPADAYYADAVAWAQEKGITTGATAEYFRPNAPCTRENGGARGL